MKFKYARFINSEIGGLKYFNPKYVNADFLMKLYKERYNNKEIDEDLFKNTFEIIVKELRRNR